MLVAAFFSVVCAAAVQENNAVPGKVNADWLNVRSGAGLDSPVAGKLPQNTDVRIIREVGNWLEIAAPEALKLYISEARVNPDGTLNGELNIRTAMSTSAVSLGILPKGTKVERLDERANGWVRIKPPADLRVFVAAFCVSYDKNAFANSGIPKKAAETVPNADADAKAAPAENKTAAPVPAKSGIVPVEKVEDVTMKGTLAKWKYSEIPETAYALLDSPNGRNLGFIVFAEPGKLAVLDGKNVTVTGKITGRTAAGAAIITAGTVVENKAE